MANRINDETIEYVGILAKLELDDKQKEQAKADLEKMLDFFDKLSELDTREVEPMNHLYSLSNRFREDVVSNENNCEQILSNAPKEKEGCFVVPRILECSEP